ncbi:MAG: voltage-gated potassium channel [Arenicella sp.]|jgi:voltage-gated potassium channel
MANHHNTSELKPWQKKLNEITFGSETRGGKWFDIILLSIIVISVIAVMLESIPLETVRLDWGFSNKGVENWSFVLFIIEWSVTVVFTIEFIARLLCVKKPLRYIFSFYGLIDLISLLPTYIGLYFTGTEPLRVLRSVRLLRIFRILKLSQFVEDSMSLTKALKSAKNKIVVFLMAVLTLVIILGTIMYLVEDPKDGFTSIPRSIYWAVVTLTTVGYGDIAPVTALGQFIASIVMIMGYAIIAVPTGIVTKELMTGESKPVMTNSACSSCGKDGHEEDAHYCKHCGDKL